MDQAIMDILPLRYGGLIPVIDQIAYLSPLSFF